MTRILGIVMLALALWVGFMPVQSVPPLGALLDPVRGAWALARSAQHPTTARAGVASLGDSVDIRYDDRGVPHIFATSELDATRALGYVVARDRLFQLELQTRASAGTLTELVGARALAADRDTRRLGLPWGAQRKFAAIDTGSAEMRAMRAYAEGVNAYIDEMTAENLPLEYRLLNRRPQRWRPEHTMLVLVRMGYTLASSSFELGRAHIEARIGRDATDALFPRDAYIQEPIVPTRAATPRLLDGTLPAPRPDSSAAARARVLAALAALTPQLARGDDNSEAIVGSNSWAVAPARTANGHALLANDPHLALSLPSTWYEAHLVVRDSLDVYGVTLPGSTGIVLGLNRDIAWGATNVGADVADYYLETVDDPLAPTRYQVDGAWRELAHTVEEYRGPRGELLATDTLRYTHRGPMTRAGARWVSSRWTVLEPSSEFDAFRAAQRARSAEEFFTAMRAYEAPAQNMLVADRDGHIGIRSNGRYPVRPGDGRGDRLFDGSKSAEDWTGWIAPWEAPQALDPAQGFLASANQQPADPRDFAAYLGNEWPTPWRAIRINELLRATSRATPDDLRVFQTDAGSARADAFVPLLLNAATATLAAGPSDTVLERAAQLLAEWDRRYAPDNPRAILFERALAELPRLVWDELLSAPAEGTAAPTLIATPPEHVLFALAREPNSIWWDHGRTAPRESRDQILATALRDGLVGVERDRGAPTSDGWRWSGVRRANIWHPLRLPALSALDLVVQGGRETLSPSSGAGTHGASWRLVAELGRTVTARAIYPGGQSANPLSAHYRDRIETWRRGELDSLRIPATPAALSAAHSRAALTLVPRR